MKIEKIELGSVDSNPKNRWSLFGLLLGIGGLFPFCGIPFATGALIVGTFGLYFAFRSDMKKGLVLSILGLLLSFTSLFSHGYSIVKWKESLEEFILDPPLLFEDLIKAQKENDINLMNLIVGENEKNQSGINSLVNNLENKLGKFKSVRIDEVAFEQGYSMEPIFDGDGMPQDQFELVWPLLFDFSDSKNISGTITILYNVENIGMFVGIDCETRVMEVKIEDIKFRF